MNAGRFVDHERLKRSRAALDAVNKMLRSPNLSPKTCRHLENLKLLLEVEISSMSSEPGGGGSSDGDMAAD
jgi:hypothetical protein